jgi:hypothetical protein
MSPKLRIEREIASSHDGQVKSKTCLLTKIDLPDTSGAYNVGTNLVKIDMNGINGNRDNQHLVVESILTNGRISVPIRSVDGKGSVEISKGVTVDVYVAKATVRTRNRSSIRRWEGNPI